MVDSNPKPDTTPDGEDPERIGNSTIELTDVAGGCLTAAGSALFSCFLLIVNGALVMAMLAASAAAGATWLLNEKTSQFLLFSMPVGLLIIQWMLIDTLQWILRRRASGSSEPG